MSAQIRINKKTIQRLPSVVSLWGRLNELYSAVSVKTEGEATALCVERVVKTPNGAQWERDWFFSRKPVCRGQALGREETPVPPWGPLLITGPASFAVFERDTLCPRRKSGAEGIVEAWFPTSLLLWSSFLIYIFHDPLKGNWIGILRNGPRYFFFNSSVLYFPGYSHAISLYWFTD